jgi:hypothetical protein
MLQVRAATSQAWEQGVHDTTHPPTPSATAVTDLGDPGPTAVVVKLTGVDAVDSLFM